MPFRLLLNVAATAVVLTGAIHAQGAEPRAPEPFATRGYYITLMRMPTYGLDEWKRAVDRFADEDRINFLILWAAGGFKSKKFPVTWKYKAEHENVRQDFLRELIDHAHAKKIKVVLGFTPFAYDGTNQYPLEHPELAARDKDGKPVALGGIHCWGRHLCPSRPESQRFMLEYAREMIFDFYPNADGLLIESSDYSTCYCDDCRTRYFEKEFGFVRRISDELWAQRPDATILVYPHYFSGKPVPGFDNKGISETLDKRWTLFFTPHSAHLDAKLIDRAGASIYWDDTPALHGPEAIAAGARRARDAKVSGYVPSLEAFSFVPYMPEEGQRLLVGKRLVPYGFGWLPPEKLPYDELPVRVNRLAYREFSANPDLPFEAFKKTLATELLGPEATVADADDLLAVQRAFFSYRSWCQPSIIVSPETLAARKAAGALPPEQVNDVHDALARLRGVEQRHRGADSAGPKELHQIARWVLRQWEGENARLLD